jgi:hypothetical protein
MKVTIELDEEDFDEWLSLMERVAALQATVLKTNESCHSPAANLTKENKD